MSRRLCITTKTLNKYQIIPDLFNPCCSLKLCLINKEIIATVFSLYTKYIRSVVCNSILKGRQESCARCMKWICFVFSCGDLSPTEAAID